MKEHRILELHSQKYRVLVDTFGATILYFGTKEHNYVLSHKSLLSYEDDPDYMGKIVGPYANRIEKHSFSLDGNEYILEDNDNGNNLHSASACFGNKTWTLLEHKENSVTLTLREKEEGGFPGDKNVKVVYTLSGGSLSLDITCSSTKRCVISCVSHMYFNLGCSSKDVFLTIPSEEYIATNSSLIPLEKNPTKVEGTLFDFRYSTRIGDRRDGKYDNSFVLKENDEVRAEGNKALLTVKTSERGVQLYTGEFLRGDNLPFSGFALETGSYPNSPRRKDFPLFIMDNENIYRSSTTYTLEEKDE